MMSSANEGVGKTGILLADVVGGWVCHSGIFGGQLGNICEMVKFPLTQQFNF